MSSLIKGIDFNNNYYIYSLLLKIKVCLVQVWFYTCGPLEHSVAQYPVSHSILSVLIQLNQQKNFTCFTVDSSVSRITCTTVCIDSIDTSSIIHTGILCTFINICKAKYKPLPVSQLDPVYPGVQEQLCLLFPSMQVPLFSQGSEAHLFTSLNQIINHSITTYNLCFSLIKTD